MPKMDKNRTGEDEMSQLLPRDVEERIIPDPSSSTKDNHEKAKEMYWYLKIDGKFYKYHTGIKERWNTESFEMCPYFENHWYSPFVAVTHLAACRSRCEEILKAKGEAMTIAICRHDEAHHVPAKDLKEHERKCWFPESMKRVYADDDDVVDWRDDTENNEVGSYEGPPCYPEVCDVEDDDPPSRPSSPSSLTLQNYSYEGE